MKRIVKAELLDELPVENPRAVHSRRDLKVLNKLMGNAAIIAGALVDLPKPKRVLDLGAGDGTVSLALARKMRWSEVEFILVDRNSIVSNTMRDAFAARRCEITVRSCDVIAGFGADRVDFIFANLFLHHFPESGLRALLSRIAQCCTVFVACEPRRSAVSLLASHCVGLLGCNSVTRHDAVVSVRAGFRGVELSHLWPHGDRWSLRESATGLFSHLFFARAP